MTFETHFTWEKLSLELKLLRDEDFHSLVPLSIGINSLLWPKENVESSFRHVQFLGFEVLKSCEGQEEAHRWETLRKFLFSERGYQLSPASLQEIHENDLLMKPILDNRAGHPLPIAFLLLHLAHFLDLPMALIQARHHYILKWVRSGKTHYLDLYNEGRMLTEPELIQVLNRSSSNLEMWTAQDLLKKYLELLAQTFETSQKLNLLHIVYNLMIQLDEGNTTYLGRRALLRQKLGFSREAHGDLKRYFSFVERAQAPIELQQAWLELETIPEMPARGPMDMLH